VVGDSMRKMNVYILSMLIILSTFMIAPSIIADATHTEFETTPSIASVELGNQIIISIYVTPQDEKYIDSISTDRIDFTKEILQVVSIEKGNILASGSGQEVFNDGTIYNNQGYIQHIYWAKGGTSADEPGYFVNITFDTIALGLAYVNITECQVAYQGSSSSLPSKVKSNATINVQQNTPPYFGTPNIANDSTIDTLYVNWQIQINDTYGDLFNWTIECSNGQSNGETLDTNGTKSINIINLDYDNTYYIYVNATDPAGSELWTREWFTFKTRSQFTPDCPTSFVALTHNRTTINLSWVVESFSDKTYIEWDTEATWNIGQGNEIYNGTGNEFQHLHLDSGIRYFYQAWGWNETDQCYSILYAETNQKTGDNNHPDLNNENPIDMQDNIDIHYSQVNVDISDLDSDLMNWWIDGIYLINNSGINSGNGTISASLITPLPYDTTIIWNVHVTDKMNWTNATYSFDTRQQYIPSRPTSFNSEAYGKTQVNLSWVEGDTNVDRTVIFCDITGDWEEIYNGTGIYFEHTELDPHTIYYYRAYSYNITDSVFSTTYSAANSLTENTKPDEPINEIPQNNAPYESVYNTYLNVTVSDDDGDELTVYFYWGDGTPIAFTTVNSGEVASIFLPDYWYREVTVGGIVYQVTWLEHKNHRPAGYSWYVIVDDGYDEGETQSSTFYFNTSMSMDVSEDKKVDISDVSTVVGYYGDHSGMPGEYPADINNDKRVDISDVSTVVGYYGSTYY
jgi:hypothetical protein